MIINPSISNYEMVYIPAGEFIFGNDEMLEERPRMNLIIWAFWIGKYEVTNAQYKLFTDATGHRTPDHWIGGKYARELANHPAVCVSWFDALAYCAWAGFRLPTEVEWERAARGSDGRIYPWGNQFDPERCNTVESGLEDTTPVDLYPQGASSYGVFDMSGNVWEWSSNWYQPYPGNTYRDRNFGEFSKVLRGGAWNYLAIRARTTARNFFPPVYFDENIGFRCAKDV